MRQIAYPRHFLLLGCFVVLLIVLNRLQLLYQPVPSFALYGVLHAAALVLALRRSHGHPQSERECEQRALLQTQSQPQSLARKFAFIVMAAALSVFALGVGLAGRQLIDILAGSGGLYALLSLSSFTGALTYGVLIRLFWIGNLTPARLATIAFGCLLATLLAFYMLSRFTLLGRWWPVVLWWYALSIGLWHSEKPRSAISDHLRPT